MIIGVDFDNTIVQLDDLFFKAAREKDLVPAMASPSKEKVRDHLRSIGREDDWTELQGVVYGSRLNEAQPFPGVLSFFEQTCAKGIPVSIISHKTKTPYRGASTDLHQAAQDWLEKNGFYSKAKLERSNVFFELTKQQKLERIGERRCTHFIDDLPEFLSEPGFPNGVEKILFDPHGSSAARETQRRAASWSEISTWLLSR